MAATHVVALTPTQFALLAQVFLWAPCTGLLGAAKLSADVAATAAPATATKLPPPVISFQIDDEEEPIVEEADRWRDLAQRAAGLQQLECSEDLLGATTQMVDAAEEGDSLAMAGLGAMCTRMRRLRPNSRAS